MLPSHCLHRRGALRPETRRLAAMRDAIGPAAKPKLIELGKELEKFASDKDSDEKNMLEKVKAFERTFPEP